MKKLLLILILLTFNRLKAEILLNPDENTLWLEDGINMSLIPESSFKPWRTGNGLNVEGADKGGFILDPIENDRGGTTGGCFAFDREFPYVTWEITEVTAQQPGGYESTTYWYFSDELHLIPLSMIRPEAGIYSVNLGAAEFTSGSSPFWRIDVNGVKVAYKYIKCVRIPENYIEVSSPAFPTKGKLDSGDELVIRVHLSQPADEVELQCFYQGRKLTINDQEIILPKSDTNKKTWTVTQKIDSCMGATDLKPGEPFPLGQLIIKASFPTEAERAPLFTANHYPFHINR